ncbi:3'-phosphoesterase / DNA ligase D / DNA repair polymerase [Pararobbsia alpina]|uniref:DNA ligase D n=1 Tax=Pararobbsia alpina TaxID=621374 RepID=UPI0039A54E28
MNDKLGTYQRKRRFDDTPEPSGHGATRKTKSRAASGSAKTRRSASSKRTTHALSFVIQEHHAKRLHYDFRLELDGTLKSWAIPKGPSLDPSVKRLAVHVEDHPIEYGSFEGEIPPGNYGAGTVVVWDRGTWAPEGDEDAEHAYRAGKMKFTLSGEKLHGGWALVRSHMPGSGDKEQWLLIKERDDDARSEADYDVIAECPGSVLHARPSTARRGTREKAHKTRTRKGTDDDDALTGTVTRSVRRASRSAKRPDIVSTRDTASLLELADHPAIKGAAKARLPETFKPQLATLVDGPPSSSEDWTYEIKFDGYRVLTRIDRQNGTPRVRIFTRAGNDWTERFGKLPDAFAALPIESAWLDGEAVVLDRNGLPNFQALQNAFDVSRPQDMVVYLFDIPFLNGYDLRKVPLVQRRAILHALIEDAEPRHVRFSENFDVDIDSLLKSACDMSLEGIIGKRIDSPYTSTRSPNWIKLKCRRRQEFVIGGYTDPSGSRAAFGALLLGVYDRDGKLQYAGRVGTGFNAKTLKDVKAQLDRRERKTMPFAAAPSERSRTAVHWVKPELVAECDFAEWTQEQIVRQASFISLRTDKPARQIVREAPHAPSAGSKDMAHTSASHGTAKRSRDGDATEIEGVRVSHPDRVIDKQSKATKLDLVQYYASIADRMLTELEDRPIAIVRAPEDIGGELFFQKHSQKLSIPGVTQHPDLDPGHPALMSIDTPKALIGAAQMGTVEIHTWNARADSIEKPDRVIFDLDPDPSLGWERMIEAAQLTHTLLDELGITSFCKTSGGKGFHIVVPLVRRAGWDEVKDFAQAVSEHMAATLPDHFSARMGAQNRKKKIFIDYLRNNRGSTTVAAFSPRARPGLGVSVPIAWNEVDTTTAGDQWNIFNLHERLERLKTNPWAGYERARQSLTAEIRKRLGIKGKR